MNLEIKKQFRKESGKDIFVWGEDKSLAYTEAYVEWLEKKLNTSNAKDQKEIKKGDVMEVVKEIWGHGFKIGTHVTVVEIFKFKGGLEYECQGGISKLYYLDAEELSHIKTETK